MLTPDLFDTWLAQGLLTEDLAVNGPNIRDNNFGYGLIDALKAVQAAEAAQTGNAPLLLSVQPSSVSFGGVVNSIDVETSRVGGSPGDMAIVGAPQENAAWLTVTGTALDANNLGTYSPQVDRTGLADGVYNATVTLNTLVNGTTAGTVSLPVSMRVGADPTPGDTGFTFVILVDAQTGDTVQTVAVGNSNGDYAYQFDDVSVGLYQIFAGTDSDNDLVLCDEGESCGGYPTFALTEVVVVDGNDISGLDFIINFSLGLGGNSTGMPNPRRSFSRNARGASEITKSVR